MIAASDADLWLRTFQRPAYALLMVSFVALGLIHQVWIIPFLRQESLSGHAGSFGIYREWRDYLRAGGSKLVVAALVIANTLFFFTLAWVAYTEVWL